MKNIVLAAFALLACCSAYGLNMYTDSQYPNKYLGEGDSYSGTFDIVSAGYDKDNEYVTSAEVKFGFWGGLDLAKEWVKIDLDGNLLNDDGYIEIDLYQSISGPVVGSALFALSTTGYLDYTISSKVNPVDGYKWSWSKWKWVPYDSENDVRLKEAHLTAYADYRKGDANGVPDSGSSLALLGLGLVGIFFARRRAAK